MEQQSTLQLIRHLCEELNTNRIAYCHWKSNAMLDRSRSGDNDLDLLIGRADALRFTEILSGLGFKQAFDSSDRQMPGVLDFYGYDIKSDELVHVHAHYRLILGHDATKNYHLPIETVYLESATQGDLFKVPAPEFELIVFVIRMVLKHSTWDAILGGLGALSTFERQELEYLQMRVSEARMNDVLNQHVPYVGAAFFSDCVRALQPGCPFWTRVRIGQQLQNRLRAHARRTQIVDVCLRLWRRVIWPVQWRVLGHFPKKRVVNGGLMVALVGGDGAGKSTAANELNAWLSQEFETIELHMGKPPWSWMTIVVRGILKIGRSLGLYPFMRASIQYTLETKSIMFPGYPWMLREVCTARDRHRAYVKARRYAANGGLVICDRFPLPQLKFMDGPQVERMTSNCQTNRFIEFLTNREKQYYRKMGLPELLIVLKVEPETAVQRKQDEDAVSVRPRCAEIWELDWRHTSAHVIDANRSKPEVLSDIKALVWSQL